MTGNCRFEYGQMIWDIANSLSKVPPVVLNGLGASFEVLTNDSSIEAKSERVSSLTIEMPIETVSEANGLLSKTRFYKNGKPKPEHWTEKSARHKEQKRIVYLFLNPHRDKLRLPCTVTMTRMASHFLDEKDNLRVSLKWVADAIAEVLTQNFVPGRADEDVRITWKYDQIKSKAKGVKILFEF